MRRISLVGGITIFSMKFSYDELFQRTLTSDKIDTLLEDVSSSDPPLVSPLSVTRTAGSQQRFFLSVCVLVRNEANKLIEFVRHYLEEGVDHVYILNDHSSDDFQHRLQRCFPMHLYSVWNMSISKTPKPWQPRLLDTMLERWRAETTWIIIVDVDEFMASRLFPQKTIRDVLMSKLVAGCHAIQVPWLIYSWGNLTQTPKNIRCSLPWRWSLDPALGRNVSKGKFRDRHIKIETKGITQPIHSNALHMHFPILKRGSTYCKMDGASVQKIAGQPGPFVQVQEDMVDKLVFAANHYRIISFEDLQQKQLSQNSWSSDYRRGKLHVMNRMDVHDDFLCSKRRSARASNPIQRAAEHIKSEYTSCRF